MSGGVILVDYDSDGYSDIYFTNAQASEQAGAALRVTRGVAAGDLFKPGNIDRNEGVADGATKGADENRKILTADAGHLVMGTPNSTASMTQRPTLPQWIHNLPGT